jgi:adenylylsulfate kinase-like enzyme
MRDEARSRLPRFIEVFVSTPHAECAACDPKGIYGDGSITFEYEPPLAAEVTTDGATDEDGIERILELIRATRAA